MIWDINIEKVENGYLLEYDEECEDENSCSHKVVFPIEDSDNPTRDGQKALREVFHFLMDYFAVYNDKHANDGEGQYMEIKVTGDEE